ncbi:MAG: ferredoxin [Sediminibacterium sp.]|nr:ferredoxin [Sediminibacterium sp.]TXT32707.1 MAG: ferredoxin [Chitinophagaceae bacterium]
MSKILHYRSKCIGCGFCIEQQPAYWCMSKKDGKATLINSVGKNGLFILSIPVIQVQQSKNIAAACPVRIIKVQ